MTAPGETGRSQLSRILRAAGVWAAFAAAGPAIGGLLVFCCIYPMMMVFGLDTAAVPDGSAQPPAFDIFSLATTALFVVAMAYAFGGPQAVLTGAWAAYATFKHGSFTARGVIAAAVVATLLWIALVYSPLSPIDTGDAGGARKSDGAVRIALTLTPIGIVSALFVRWLCRVLGLTPRSSR